MRFRLVSAHVTIVQARPRPLPFSTLRTAMTHVTIPVDDLADALGSTSENLRLALDLAERLGGVRVQGKSVALPLHAIALLGLVQDVEDGRWSVARGADALAVPPDLRGRKNHGGALPLLFPGNTPDRRAVEPWRELSLAEEPPSDRVEAICRWLDRWTARTPPVGPYEGPPDGETFHLEPGPQPPLASRQPAEADALRRPQNPGRSKVKARPAPARDSFSLSALRARLDTV